MTVLRRCAAAVRGRYALLIALAACTLLSPVLLTAATFNQVFREGVEYADIYPPVPTSVKNGVEVVEMFWYGCETCYLIQPYMANWRRLQPKSVHYLQRPAVLSADMDVDARAYYAARALGVLSRTHVALFRAIHEEHRKLDSPDRLAAFFAEYGVDKDDFLRAYNSPAVAGAVFRERNLTARYGIPGVPAIIIDGRYYTDPTRVKSPEELVEVVNFLVQLERRRLND